MRNNGLMTQWNKVNCKLLVGYPTDRQTDRQTDRVSCRGAFAPKNSQKETEMQSGRTYGVGGK